MFLVVLLRRLDMCIWDLYAAFSGSSTRLSLFTFSFIWRTSGSLLNAVQGWGSGSMLGYLFLLIGVTWGIAANYCILLRFGVCWLFINDRGSLGGLFFGPREWLLDLFCSLLSWWSCEVFINPQLCILCFGFLYFLSYVTGFDLLAPNNLYLSAISYILISDILTDLKSASLIPVLCPM